MTAAIVDDGIPDDLGRAGLLIITDTNAERAYRGEWRLTADGRLVLSVGESIHAAQVAAMIEERNEPTA
jgi:hypothetical protein